VGPTPNTRVSEQEVVPVNVTSIKCLLKQEQPRLAVVTRKWRAVAAMRCVSANSFSAVHFLVLFTSGNHNHSPLSDVI